MRARRKCRCCCTWSSETELPLIAICEHTTLTWRSKANALCQQERPGCLLSTSCDFVRSKHPDFDVSDDRSASIFAPVCPPLPVDAAPHLFLFLASKFQHIGRIRSLPTTLAATLSTLRLSLVVFRVQCQHDKRELHR